MVIQNNFLKNEFPMNDCTNKFLKFYFQHSSYDY